MEVVHKRTSKKKWIVIGLIAAILTITAINITIIQNKKNNTSTDLKFATVTKKEISNTKLIAGRIVPGNMETYRVDPTKGKVKEIFVKAGQKVKKGDKLFVYNDADVSIQEKQLEIDQKSTDLRSKQLNDKMASLKKQIQKAKDEHASAEVIDPLETQWQDLQSQQQSLNLEIEKNKLTAEQLKNKRDDLTVYSSIDGVVLKANPDAGQNISQTSGVQGDPIVQIVSKDPYQIEGTLTELQKAQIQVNQPITITAKAAAGKTWTGKIIEISDYPTSSESAQDLPGNAGTQPQNISYYNFKAALDSQEGLSPGYHVSVQVELSKKKMPAVPNSSIVEKGDSSYVYVVMNHKLHKQKITKGNSDGEWTEIPVGLKPGEQVVDHPSDRLYEGMEVEKK